MLDASGGSGVYGQAAPFEILMPKLARDSERKGPSSYQQLSLSQAV